MDITNFVLVFFVLSIIGFYSLEKKLLNKAGVMASIVFGAITFAIAGKSAFITLIAVYFLAQITTKISMHKKKHETRSLANVLGNVGPGIIFLLLGFPLGFYGSMASAIADTTASEIGMLSKRKPRLITNFKEVEKGTDGAITLLGTFFAFFSAFLIAITYFLLVNQDWKIFILIILSGFLGMIIDSVLGATLQKKGLLDNNSVNFIANFLAGIICVAVLP
ncbi:MAG: DUF92 domain-containing protein [Candidatus Diapherotrites archaeon]